jgi:hypothetical protein
MAANSEGIDELLQRAKGLGLKRWADIYGESEAAAAARYLRARKGKVSDALALLEADMQWRESENIENLASRSIKDITGIDENVMQSYLPTWCQGYDKVGRPVIYTAYGNLEVDTLIKKGSSVEKLLLMHIHHLER